MIGFYFLVRKIPEISENLNIFFCKIKDVNNNILKN